MHPYFVYELARQRIAERQREAQSLRLLKDARPEPEPRTSRLSGFAVPGFRRYPRPVTRGAC